MKDYFLMGLEKFIWVNEVQVTWIDGTQSKLTVKFANENRPLKLMAVMQHPYNFDALQELFGIALPEDCDEAEDDD